MITSSLPLHPNPAVDRPGSPAATKPASTPDADPAGFSSLLRQTRLDAQRAATSPTLRAASPSADKPPTAPDAQAPASDEAEPSSSGSAARAAPKPKGRDAGAPAAAPRPSASSEAAPADSAKPTPAADERSPAEATLAGKGAEPLDPAVLQALGAVQQQATAAAAKAGEGGEPGATPRLAADPVDGSGDPQAAAAAALAAFAGAADPAATTAAAAPVATTVSASVDTPDFARELGLRMSVLVADGVQHAELHLNPAELGPVSVQIVLDGTQARIDFGADAAATRQAIESGLPQLASALRDAGFTLAGGGVSQQGSGRSGGGGEADDSRGKRRLTAVGSEAASRVGQAAQRLVRRGGVDLFA